ncbi:hypothetical protein TWF481_006483 [Arthrobotrys musiformis]|uniref:Spherulation-specific family 4 n=1 Tax=Arthrobotrys musiformis TaxID=47236 RepID=A0AAV9WED6_9PEZI
MATRPYITTLSLTSVLIPLYIYPAPGAWGPLYKVVATYPAQPFTVIINPHSGPGGERFPNATYIDAIIKLKKFQNVRVIGYVHVSYGARKIEEVCQDVDRYVGWVEHIHGVEKVGIAMDGIFVDEAPADILGKNGSDNLKYMQSLRSRILKRFRGIAKDGFTMTNPGIIADKQFYEFADAVVSFEDRLANYYSPGKLQTSKDMSKSPGTAPGKQAIIVTSFDGTEARERHLLTQVVERGIGFVYFTTDSDYQNFGADLTVLVDQVARSNGLVGR